jgi:REP element-mobilizing transposase RayT
LKQRHSFHRLFYHLVFATKHREPWIAAPEDGVALLGLFRAKAAALDAYVEEFGCYKDHVHLLLRSGPTVALSELYGQLKGFAAWEIRGRCPSIPFRWQDGVWIETVAPARSDSLRTYIRDQWRRHESRSIIEEWEPPSDCP